MAQAKQSCYEGVDVGDRPTFGQAARSPTALWNLAASFLLMACFFLPHSTGCDLQVHRPLSIATAFAADQDSGLMVYVIFWPYAMATLTFVLFVALVMRRPRQIARPLLALPLIGVVAWMVVGAILLFSGRDGSRTMMIIGATTFPFGTFVAARMYWLCRRGEVLAAAQWGQGWWCVMAVFSLRWYWFPPVNRLAWGGVLAIVAALLMMFASWTWPLRARHDLSDREVQPEPFQVSILQLISAVSLTAVALTYWRWFRFLVVELGNNLD